MAEEPEEVLPEKRLSTSGGDEKARAGQPVEQEHGECRGENGQGQEEQYRHYEQRPDNEWQAKEGHARRPHVHHGRNVVDGAHHRRDRDQQKGYDPYVLPPVDPRPSRVGGERRIGRPTCRRVSSRDEEPCQHYNTGQRPDPEGEHVKLRERHVVSAYH